MRAPARAPARAQVMVLAQVSAATIVLALLHVPIASYLGWRKEPRSTSALTRQVFWVHAWFLCLTLAMMGMLSSFQAEALLEDSTLARSVLGGFAVFWVARLYCQWFVYDTRHWRGLSFETFIHVTFTFLWLYLSAVYAMAFFTGQFRTSANPARLAISWRDGLVHRCVALEAAG